MTHTLPAPGIDHVGEATVGDASTIGTALPPEHTDAPTDVRAARRAATRESLGATAALGLATVVFAMTSSGKFTNYVQPWFKPYLLASCGIIAILAVWSLIAASDALDRAEAGERTDGSAQPHSHGVPRVAALIAIPVLLFALCAPNSLGASAAGQRPVRARVAGVEPVAFTALPERGVTELTVQDYSDRWIWGDPALLEGRRVRMIGFVAQPVGKSYWTMNRFRIYCCAADANLFSVGVAGVDKPAGKDVWVEVTGVIDLRQSTEVPVLVPDEVRIIDTPAEPYL